jgi:hypothetical protein
MHGAIQRAVSWLQESVRRPILIAGFFVLLALLDVSSAQHMPLTIKCRDPHYLLIPP